MATTEIILKEGDTISVTTEKNKIHFAYRYVYLTCRGGKIEISGNSAVVDKISGYGMANKVTD